MLIIKKGAFLFLLSFFVHFYLLGAPYYGEVFQLLQPDRSPVTVRVWGDELYQDVMGIDGEFLIRDPGTRWICYARGQGDELISTGRIYRLYDPDYQSSSRKGPVSLLSRERIHEKRRETRALLGEPVAVDTKALFSRGAAGADIAVEPLTGSITGLVLLIDFPDQRAAITRGQVERVWNQSNYNGDGYSYSVRDWFFEASNQQLEYTNIVTDYITMSKPKSYYDTPDCGYCRVHELLNEALTSLERRGFDFSRLTVEAGRIMALNVVYSGNPEAGWARGIWPHAGGYYDFSADGVSTGSYQMSAAGDGSDLLPVGTFIHENGHMVGKWPDLYAYDGHDGGIGAWDNGMPNPYFLHLRGWIDLTDITSAPGGSVHSLPANRRKALIYNGPGGESYYIEARRRRGYNLPDPGEGLLIWHTYLSGDNTYDYHLNLVSLVQADGLLSLEKELDRGNPEDAFFQGNNSTFNDSTQPSARWYTGENSGLNIENIGPVADTMTLTLGNPRPVSFPVHTPGSGTGLKGVYYDNLDFTGLSVERLDSEINFTWDDKPHPSIGRDTFSVLWTGAVESYNSGMYRFWTETDDGFRLRVDGRLIIDAWKDQGVTEYEGDIFLPGGSRHRIEIEYYEQNRGATARLYWSGEEHIKTIIPMSRLYPGELPASYAGETGNGLLGEYFNNMDFTDLRFSRVDEEINFDWAEGSPGGGVDADTFSVRWSGFIQPLYSGEYVFRTVSDDGVRLRINNQLVIDDWNYHSAAENLGVCNLSAGFFYPIELEYDEYAGGAEVVLEWYSGSQVHQVIPRERLFTQRPGTPAPTPIPSPTPEPLLLAHYPLEGDLRDTTGNHHGQASGAPSYNAGVVGDLALYLDGADDRVTIPRSVTNSFSIAYWLKTSDRGETGDWWAGKGIVDGEVDGVASDFGTSLAGDYLAFGMGNPDITIYSLTPVNDGVWHHVAVTREEDSGEMVLFIDGVREASATGPRGVRSAPGRLAIGSLLSNLNYLQGALDEIRIYNYVLSDGEVAALAELPGFTGDVNKDGVINIVDALMTAQFYVGLNPPGFFPGPGDVDNSGVIDIIDALKIAQWYVGLIDHF